MKLYTYRRSQASFRLRIAVNLKGIAREDSFLPLEKGDLFAAAYRAFNPQMVVPTLSDVLAATNDNPTNGSISRG